MGRDCQIDRQTEGGERLKENGKGFLWDCKGRVKGKEERKRDTKEKKREREREKERRKWETTE